jgi:hypothetical protein
MELRFKENEFTFHGLLGYLKRVYGTQINGRTFSSYNVNDSIHAGKISMLYGDPRILNVVKTPEFGGLKVFTLEELTRDILEDINLIQLEPVRGQLPETERPRKHRTRLYYQILEKVGKQYASKTLSMLPKQWKQAGVKGKQLVKTSRKNRNQV